MSENPKTEIRSPNEIRIPNCEAESNAAHEHFGFRPSGFFRISAFGFRN
jgi:hypothetical protein